jgi:hypothetical protein
MAKYNVYLIDPLNEIQAIVRVATILNDWLDPIAQQAGFEAAFVCFPQYIVQPKGFELLVYICPFATSVVQKMFGADNATARKNGFPDPVSRSEMGITAIRGQTGSEMWAKTSDVDLQAGLIFHEAMHNQLQLGDQMHGMFKPCSLSCASITPPFSPSAPEVQAMVKALKKPAVQWSDGQSLLWSAAQAKANGDPLWNAAISA